MISTGCITACSGTTEKPVSDSITSPARQLDRGVYHYNNGNYPRAITNFNKALLQYRSIDNQMGIANSCMNLAKVYMLINHNQIAAEYLTNANATVKNAQLTSLQDHLHLLNASLAIKTLQYNQALQELDAVTNINKNINIQMAVLKNQTHIAFLKNDSDKKQWLEQYRKLQKKHPENTQSHAARILRFEAELSANNNKKELLLKQALSISRDIAARTAIAATLTQWAEVDTNEKKYRAAENKLLRALFIRHQLSDVQSSLLLLQQLNTLYVTIDNKKQLIAKYWIDKISKNNLSEWEKLFTDFDTFPEI